MMQNLKKRYDMLIGKMTFRKLLTLTLVSLVTVAFLTLSILMTYLSERKIRENVRDNMSVVVEQYDVYLGNYIQNIVQGFSSFESNSSLIQLQLTTNENNNQNNRAMCYLTTNHLFNQFLNANTPSVYAVYFNFNNGQAQQQVYQRDMMHLNYTYSVWKDRFPDSQYYWVDADYCRDLIPDQQVGAVLFHLYEDVNSKRNGIVLIAIKEDFFENILNATSLNESACISLVSDYGIMKFGDEQAGEDVKKNELYLKNKQKNEQQVQSEVLGEYYYIYEDMPQTGWKLVYNIKENSISNLSSVKRDVMLLGCVWIVALAVIVVFISKAASYSLHKLTERVSAKDVLEKEINIYSYEEITSLSIGLENMRQRILLLLDQVKLEQTERNYIEMALLQEQINPHFLYNTLYACMQLCEMKQPEKASEMLEALANFYRIGLNNGKKRISVREEIEHVRNYLFIQHFRYSDVFDYTIDCAPEIMSCCIPKMSLQPLVENAIYHGVKQKQSFGSICIIGGSTNGKDAYLEVHDDGSGISADKILEIKKELKKDFHERKNNRGNKRFFGLKNIDTRIKYEFGSEYGLDIYSNLNDTCVRISFQMQMVDTSEMENEIDESK